MTNVRTSAAYKTGYQDGYADAEKAYGKCHFCYGKGYSTQQFTQNMLPRTVVKPCACDRGEQIRRILP